MPPTNTPAAAFSGTPPVCSVCSCLCCNGMPNLKAYEYTTETVLGTTSQENWYTVAGDIFASPNTDPWRQWFRDNPSYWLGETAIFGGTPNMCVNLGSGAVGYPATYLNWYSAPLAGDSVGYRAGCLALGDGKGFRQSLGNYGGISSVTSGTPCRHNCSSVATLPTDFIYLGGPNAPLTSADAGTVPACDQNSGWGAAPNRQHIISDYGFYISTHSICGSGIARKYEGTGPLTVPLGSTPPFAELPCAICARPVVGVRPMGANSTCGWYRPNVRQFPASERGTNTPPTFADAGVKNAAGYNLMYEDFSVSYSDLAFQTWRLTPDECTTPPGPTFKYVGGWPFTVTVTVNVPEAWIWRFPFSGPNYLIKLADAQTITRTVSGFFRGTFKQNDFPTPGLSHSTAYVLAPTSVTCSGDECTRQFVYSPGQSEYYADMPESFDSTAPTLRLTAGPFDVVDGGTTLFQTDIAVLLVLFAGIKDITEGACGGYGVESEELGMVANDEAWADPPLLKEVVL